MEKLYKFFTIVASLPLMLACGSSPNFSSKENVKTEPFARITHAVKSARDFYELGRYYHKRHDFESALKAYWNAVDIEHNHLGARNGLGLIFASQGKLGEAITEFKIAVTVMPHDARSHNNLGYALYLDQRYPDAIASIEKAIKLAPTNIRAYNNLATVYARSGQPEKSYLTLERVKALTASSDRVDYTPILVDSPNNNKALSIVSPTESSWHLGQRDQNLPISLSEANWEMASHTLHGPDDLLLKVDIHLDRIPAPGTLRWEPPSEDVQGFRPDTVASLRLKPITGFTLGLAHTVMASNKAEVSLHVATPNSVSTGLEIDEGLMLKVDDQMPVVPTPGELRWHTVIAPATTQDAADSALHLKISMLLTLAPQKKSKDMVHGAAVSKSFSRSDHGPDRNRRDANDGTQKTS